jgi:beta-mannosidase
MHLVGAGGKTYAEHARTVSFGPNRAAKLAVLHEQLENIPEEVFFLDLQLIDSTGTRVAHNRYTYSRTTTLAPLFSSPATRLSISSQAGESERILTLTNTGATAAMSVWLEDARDLNAAGYAYFDDNYFSLLPGELRTVRVTWIDAEAEEQRLEVSAWNTGRILLNLSVEEEARHGVE